MEKYVKRTQRDYSMSFKFSVVKEIETGALSAELESQVKLLEKQKAFLEKQAYVADKKAIIFDMMINLAEQEYQIDIRKNSYSELSKNSHTNKKKP